MKTMKYITTTALLLITISVSAETWTNMVGSKLDADFVKLERNIVYLKTPEGKVRKIKLADLCKEDQEKAKQLASPFKNAKTVKKETPADQAKDPLYELFKTRLRTHKDKKASTDSLKGKIIGIYFSAHWCGPCQNFTPKLVKFHKEMAKQRKPFEVVFVSSDYTATKMLNYAEEMEMPWLMVPFGNDVGKNLKKKYAVSGIPRLVIIDDKGNILSNNAVGAVSGRGAAAYDQWKPKS